jgi:hypothetical protein
MMDDTKVECKACGSKHFRILIHPDGSMDVYCASCEAWVGDISEAIRKMHAETTASTVISNQNAMLTEALKMHTEEKRALLESIQKIVFDEDGADHERTMLRMLLTGGRPS